MLNLAKTLNSEDVKGRTPVDMFQQAEIDPAFNLVLRNPARQLFEPAFGNTNSENDWKGLGFDGVDGNALKRSTYSDYKLSQHVNESLARHVPRNLAPFEKVQRKVIESIEKVIGGRIPRSQGYHGLGQFLPISPFAFTGFNMKFNSKAEALNSAVFGFDTILPPTPYKIVNKPKPILEDRDGMVSVLKFRQNNNIMEALCRQLPKAELHAHLHGSVRAEKLLALAGPLSSEQEELLSHKGDRTLQGCFELFSLAHSIVRDEKALRIVFRSVVADFDSDNVRYLELRSTPRTLQDAPEGGIGGKLHFLRILLSEVEKTERDPLVRCVVRLIVSLDRARPVEEAWETFEALKRLPKGSQRIVVGVDYSGNPTKHHFSDFVPVLEAFRRSYIGNRITVHFGEMEDPEEIAEILKFRPRRVGHALFVTASERSGFVVEVCPSSNMRTLSLSSLKDHPVLSQEGLENLEFVVCSDDPGVFNTSLSKELALVAENLNLTEDQVRKLAGRSFRDAFSDANALKRSVPEATTQISQSSKL